MNLAYILTVLHLAQLVGLFVTLAILKETGK